MKKRLVFLSVVFSAALIFFAGCQKMETTEPGASGDSKGVQAGSVAEPTTPGTMATIVVGATPFTVEIAETDEQKANGLMNRESLPDNSGMWFIFDKPVQEKFWMKDTLIPLDMIFVDENMKVVHIIANAKPNDETKLGSPVPYQYVLEVNAGTAAKYAFKPGDAVQKRIGPQ